ncbi:predicted protein [Naegleria gruberi]|uniref:Predicted protein n=1 Tax=Naegleria gruberi TaxID=5762 RepID=D2VVX1_NAEGR|nr:uncharacterized protein NAEGRDRAFT_73170 [Naegleria gruberi]EFC38916.1 predicted protein [Naegleria gruberi]|eukprot:XP_002671660.1 predicted protein [Naegleria gruberi strain NEG-M]
MQHFNFTKELMMKHSKVMGLSYLKSVAYLFILEASFTETDLSIMPTYSLYFKEYSMSEEIEILKLWLDIAFFIENHAPRRSTFTVKPFRPSSSETPLKNLKLLGGDVMLSTNTEKNRITSHRKMKKYKPIISRVKNHHDIVIVRNISVFKEVGEEERRIILKLMNRDEYCLYLPIVLNIYAKDVEFEHLHSLPSDHLDDNFLLMMACHISIALKYLHANNIVHRDVKPSNTMIRPFNNPTSLLWIVLIDFGLSFEMVKEQGECYQLSSSEGKKTLVNENVGTYLFQAPEVHKKQNYDEKIDIYSLGATLLYLKNKTSYEIICKKDEFDLQVDMQTLQWDDFKFGKKYWKWLMKIQRKDLQLKSLPIILLLFTTTHKQQTQKLKTKKISKCFMIKKDKKVSKQIEDIGITFITLPYWNESCWNIFKW